MRKQAYKTSCLLLLLGALLLGYIPHSAAAPCQAPDDGTGTATFPADCPYDYSATPIIISAGLPAGTTIEAIGTLADFTFVSPSPGGTLGGEMTPFDAVLYMEMTGTGALVGFNRTIFVPVFGEVHTAPRNPGDAVQSFDTEMVQLQGELFGDPDFCELRVRAGIVNNLPPSPGHTTLTRLGPPGSDFNVDSFFDIFYEIDFQGCPGSVLEGFGGTSDGASFFDQGDAIDPPEGLEYGDAPEDALAYPSLGVFGFFPTCKNIPIAGYIEHNNFGAYFGGPATAASFDFEPDGNGGLCPTFGPYDNDECFMDGDAGLLFPGPATIVGGAVTLCPQSPGGSLGATCTQAQWGINADIEITNQMPNGTIGFVNVLADWNQDGIWGGIVTCSDGTVVDEYILQDLPVPNPYVGPLSNLLPPGFTIGPNSGYVWVRFSITNIPLNNPNWDGSGVFEDGETEDYLLHIDGDDPTEDLDFGDAPDIAGALGYPTLLANNGARHIILSNGPYFADVVGGDFPDPELDGQPDPQALGDDLLDGNDDEDGVVVPPLIIGQNVTITFNVGGPGGIVEAFIDWNADGDWTDAGEALPSAGYPAGPGSINVAVPAAAVVGPTFARFRISQTGPFPMTEVGLAGDGEVEDHEVIIEPGEEPDEKLKFQQLPLDGLVIDNTTYYGHDELSTAYVSQDAPNIYEGCYMADDFADLESSPVIKVKWWGSYLEDPENELGFVDRFLIAFERDIPAIGHPDDPDYVPSHPGPVIHSEIVYRPSAAGLNPGEFIEIPVSSGGPPCYEPLFKYEAVLKNPFPQEPDTVYWLKIVAIVDTHPQIVPALKDCGLSLCILGQEPWQQIVTQCPLLIEVEQPIRWGWHNRDYTKMDPYASTPPAVFPGEHNPRAYIPSLPPISGLADSDVWHFQDDAVTGEVVIFEDPANGVPIVNQPNWIETYYKFWLPYCGTIQGVDGPDEIHNTYSKDLAFELWTTSVCKGDINGDGVIDALDLSALVAYLTPFAPGYSVSPVPVGDEAYNLNGDASIDALDMSALVGHLTPYAPGYSTTNCMP